jgi:hypothetical protein
MYFIKEEGKKKGLVSASPSCAKAYIMGDRGRPIGDQNSQKGNAPGSTGPV